jgi:hypothetical protein
LKPRPVITSGAQIQICRSKRRTGVQEYHKRVTSCVDVLQGAVDLVIAHHNPAIKIASKAPNLEHAASMCFSNLQFNLPLSFRATLWL